MKTLRLLLVSLLIGGCTLGPDYQRPELPLNDTYREGGLEGATVHSADGIANLPWWEVFEDPTLQRLVRQALENNRDIQLALARVEQARAALGVTRSDFFPRVDLAGNAARSDIGEEAITGIAPGPTNDFGLFTDLSFELDLWGRVRRATEADRAALLSSEHGQRWVAITIAAEVASAYFQIRGLDHRLVITSRTLKNRHDATRLINDRFEKGVVPQLDVNQAQIEEADAGATRAQIERQLKRTEHALAVLLGTVPHDIERGEPLDRQKLRSPIPLGFPAQLLERRPDVLSAEEAVRSSVARVGVAEAEQLPRLDLTGFIGLRSSEGDRFFQGTAFTWGIGGTLLGPLLDFGKSDSVIDEAEAVALQAMKSYEQSVLIAIKEVEDSLIGVQTYADEIGHRERQVAAARNASRLSRARYDQGVTPYLEVLDIERSLFDAELNESRAREEYLITIVQLYKSLGGGWGAESARTAP